MRRDVAVGHSGLATTSCSRVPWACVDSAQLCHRWLCATPSKSVAAVGHKITEGSPMGIGPWCHDDNRPAEFNDTHHVEANARKFACSPQQRTWFEDCGTHAQVSMATLATMSCWSSLSRISWLRGKRALCFGVTECVSCQLVNLKFDDVLNDLLGKDQAQTQRDNRHASRPLVVGKQWFIEGSILFRRQRSAARTSSFAVACREFENSKPSTVDVGALAR